LFRIFVGYTWKFKHFKTYICISRDETTEFLGNATLKFCPCIVKLAQLALA